MSETARRRKRQPTAEVMRQQLALAADEIIRLRAQAWEQHLALVWERLVQRVLRALQGAT